LLAWLDGLPAGTGCVAFFEGAVEIVGIVTRAAAPARSRSDVTSDLVRAFRLRRGFALIDAPTQARSSWTKGLGFQTSARAAFYRG